MAAISYISITGNRQGLISAGCSGQDSIGNKSQTGHLDEIMVLAYGHDLASAGNGSVSGRGQHMPLSITKNIDKSSPLLASAWDNSEELYCTLKLYRNSPTAGQEHYYSIRLKGARITCINVDSPHAISMNDMDPQEHVTIRYRDIIWEHITAGTSAYSSWDPHHE
ncbi:Major exported protein [compost metagenome]